MNISRTNKLLLSIKYINYSCTNHRGNYNGDYMEHSGLFGGT